MSLVQNTSAGNKIHHKYGCFFCVVIITVLSYSIYTGHQRAFFILCNQSNSLKSRDSPTSISKSKCSVHASWVYDMHVLANKRGMYSQASQDLYLEKIFSAIKSTNKYFVEFGFNAYNYTVPQSGSNTRLLYENGWRGLLLDGTIENPEINLKKHFLFSNNIARIFSENMVPKDLDFLSCDMDSHDLWVLRAILKAGYRPRVFTTEYNANYPITDAITLIDPTIVQSNSMTLNNYSFEFQNCSWGAGAAAIRLVAEEHGYTLIGRVSMLDLIWLRNDLIDKECINLPSFEWFFHDAVSDYLILPAQTSPDVLSRILDYKTYITSGGDIDLSNQAARAILKQRNLQCYANIHSFL